MGIMHRAVRIFETYAQFFTDSGQLMASHIRIQPTRELKRINDRERNVNAKAFAFRNQYRVVKAGIMGGKRRVSDKLKQCRNLH